MARDHLTALLHWRKYAGELDASHPRATIGTMLWACERWIDHPHDVDADTENRVRTIKKELEDWLTRYREAREPPETG